MSKSAQNYLLHQVRRAIEYCAKEYDMTWCEAIGCLEMVKHYYATLAFEMNEDEDDDDKDDD